jgi:hypothetical protein
MKFYCNGALALTINENGLPDYYSYSQLTSVLENYAGRFVCGKISGIGVKIADTGILTFTSSKNSVGSYTVVFEVAMSSSDYQIFITPQSTSGVRIANIFSITTTGFTARTYDYTGNLSDSIFSFFVTK